ncbi:MAG: RES family NAD+ phosphorylase [Saprospiraceae bacterium]|nr:RES family NAD+ phosphorylase [Saprospiraceae bacterium]MBK8110900.1 RES family NAD+ phosphorylase [Saprospiraceae bacterium]
MEVFRLSRARFADQLSGVGAALKGARWNSPGVEMVYTSQNRSLAMAEVLVHLSLGMLPDDFRMLTIWIPDNLPVIKWSLKDLPKNWNEFPFAAATQKMGDAFVLENEAAVLCVPSVVTTGDFNYLLNPAHPDFKKIQILESVPFPFDNRLV